MSGENVVALVLFMILFLFIGFGGYGYIENILTIFHNVHAVITGEFILRVIGVFMVPLGVVMGYFGQRVHTHKEARMARYMLLADIFGVNKGEIVEYYDGCTYGCCADDEIPVCRDGKGPFYAVPYSDLEEI